MKILIAALATAALLALPGTALGDSGVLKSSSSLIRGESLENSTHQFRLEVGDNGNVQLVNQSKRVLWATHTRSQTDHVALTLYFDGNLVLNERVGRNQYATLWQSHTGGHRDVHLAVQDDGNMVIYAQGHPIWASHTVYDTLEAHEQLHVHQNLVSPNGRYRLVNQADGNLVIYDQSSRRPTWAAHTLGCGARLVMQPNGILSDLGADGSTCWATDTFGYWGARLRLEDSGDLVLGTRGVVLWVSGWT
jgi:hypothetical protein